MKQDGHAGRDKNHFFHRLTSLENVDRCRMLVDFNEFGFLRRQTQEISHELDPLLVIRDSVSLECFWTDNTGKSEGASFDFK